MVTAEKIKTSLIEEVGVSEELAGAYSLRVMEELKKHGNYNEFYYKIFPNNKIYFFIKKNTTENSFSQILLTKGGLDINGQKY